MKNPVRIVAMGLLAALAGQTLKADSTWVYAVQISATTQVSPPKITLQWEPDQYGANSYTVYRKAKDASSWGSGTALAGSASSYVDNNVAAGSTYEYAVIKAGSIGYTGYGYIYAGINAPLVDNRGKVVLVVDNTFTAALSTELARLQSDLTGDGWTVVRRDVSRNDTPASVRSAIQSVYNADPGNVKAVFLFGHVPILRSGNLNVDGHQARLMPADGYYGDMDGSWSNPSFLPSEVELMVGRVDMFNLTGVGAPSPWPSEQELLRNYLNKDHKWRHKLISVPRRALLGNRFGDFGGEAFAASGFRNFEPLVGAGNTTLANEQDGAPVDQKWSSMLSAGTFLWAYGCGGGSYTSMSGMGTHGTYNDIWSTDIVGGDAKAVFFMMFGSWLGEWDSADNIMRSTLATSTMGLACSWAGRPHWYYHHTALGEPIGYSARISQNNGGLYQNQVNQNLRGVHIALMGDPTLRIHPVAPPSAVTAASGGSGVMNVGWSASADGVAGYHVYRATAAAGPFTRVTSSLVNGTHYADTSAPAGNVVYMVRAVNLENTPSGTYFNPSQGAFSGGAASDGGGGGPTDPGPTNSVYWIEDALPTGAVPGADGDDAWTWLSSNPAPFSGAASAQSGVSTGLHQIFFTGATDVLTVTNGDVLFAYVYLDAAHPPTEVMLQWNDGNWEHRAFWGANNISYGILGTPSRYFAGALPASGRWVRLEVPASQVGLGGSSITGMAFSLFDGRANWDAAGKAAGSGVVQPPTDTTPPTATMLTPGNDAIVLGTSVAITASVTDNVAVVGVQFKIDGANLGAEDTTAPYSATLDTTMFLNGVHSLTAVARDAASNRSTSGAVNVIIGNVIVPPNTNNDLVWFDDSVPNQGVTGGDGGDDWTWVTQDPTPFSGTSAHQSNAAQGSHQHYFNYAWGTFAVKTGEVLVTYVYLNPTNPPSEIMLQWNDGSWEHRAYWGANLNTFGANGTPSRRSMGALPAAGQWARLEVPASAVGLEGSTLKGMAFTLYNGQATWDHIGKMSSPKATIQPVPAGFGMNMVVTWPSTPGQTYRVLYKTSITDPVWTEISGPITAVDSTTSWTDISTDFDSQRFYQVVQ